jgi:hypothetical protein
MSADIDPELVTESDSIITTFREIREGKHRSASVIERRGPNNYSIPMVSNAETKAVEESSDSKSVSKTAEK